MRSLILIGILFSSAGHMGAQAAQNPEFEVASIRRNLSNDRAYLGPPVGGRFTATNVTLKLFIGLGWRVPYFAISGGPSWIATEGYDVSVKEPSPNATDDEFLLMMQSLLKERFSLKVHTETRETAVYVLAPAKSGLKLPDANPEPCRTFALKPDSGAQTAHPQPGCAGMNVTPGLIADERVSMSWFAGVLQGVLGRPVLDRTGFTGSFKLHLEFAPVTNGDQDTTKPSIFTALQEQLGLRVDSQKGPAEILVVDHAERPSEN